MFIVAAAVASLFLVQFAHAHVLRTEAHTAADAAALAAATSWRDQLLDTPGRGPPGVSTLTMRSKAASYASHNAALLTAFDATVRAGSASG